MPIIEGKAAAGTGKEGMNRLGRLPEPIFLYHIFDPLTCGIPEQRFDMPICRVMDWRKDCSISYDTIRGGKSE